MTSAQSTRTRRARRILAGASLLFCALFAASCRAVLGTDDYEPSVGALCGLLIRCFEGTIVEGCDERVAQELTDAEPIQRESWLRTFSDASCLESCASARRCLNISPVCNLSQCKVREECCGFVEGRADCNAITGACCTPKGVGCSSDAQCCLGAGPCSAITNTCGGVVCKPPGEPCVQADQCCTKVCRDQVCGEDLCRDNGLECQDKDQCCSGFCDLAKQTCSDPPCIKEGEGCAPGGNPCCGTLDCQPGPTGGHECTAKCHADGLECSSDGQCCSGRCDLTLTACVSCVLRGGACSLEGECCNGSCTNGMCPDCNTTGVGCQGNDDCCSGVCAEVEGSATKKCVPLCNPSGCAHDECVTGPPLERTCDQCTGGSCDINPTCVDRVCDEDPYCCCKSWDALCAAKAAALCKDLTNPKVCE